MKSRPESITRQKTGNGKPKYPFDISDEVFELAPIGMAIADLQGNFLRVNPSICKTLGYTEKELLDLSIADITHPEDLPGNLKLDEQLIRGQIENFEMKKRYIRKDGSIVYGLLKVVLKKDEDGQPGFFIGQIIDLTEQVKAHQALEESEARFKTLSEATFEAIMISEGNQLLDVNDRFWELFGYPPTSLKKLKAVDLVVKADIEKLKTLIKKGIDEPCQLTCKRKNGTTFPAEISEKSIEAQGKTYRVSAIRDITDRISGEMARSVSEESYRDLFNHSTELIFVQDKSGKFLDVNKAVLKLYGFTKAELLKRSIQQLGATGMNDKIAFDRYLKRVWGGRIERFDWWSQTESGKVFPKEIVLRKGKYFGREVIIASGRDISERKKVLAALQQSEERYRTLIERNLAGVYRTSIDRVVIDCNLAFARMLGYKSRKEVLGKKADQLYKDSTDKEDFIKKLLKNGSFRNHESRITLNNGATIWLLENAGINYDASGKPEYVEGTMIDITALNKAREALKESVGQYKTLVEHAPEALVVLDVDKGKFVEVNVNAMKLFKMDRQQLMKIGPDDVSPEKQADGSSSQALARKMIGMTMKGKAPVFEWLHVDSTGKLIPCEIRLVRLPSLSKNLIRGSVIDITERKKAELQLIEREKSVRQQNKLLERLTKTKSFYAGNLETSARKITEAAGKIMDVERTSVWLFNPEHTGIYTIDLYERSSGRHSKGHSLEAKDYPDYFEALEKQRTIAAYNAHTDPRTREFSDNYLTDLGITSMLDASIRFKGKNMGVICFEHTGPKRKWSTLDQNFAGSVADLITLTLEAKERNEFEAIMKRQEVMQESEKIFRQFLEYVNLVSFSLNKNGVITFINNYTLEMTGWKKEAVIGKKWFEIFVPEKSRKEEYNRFRKGMKGGDKLKEHYESAIITKGGQYKIIRWNVTRLFDENNQPAGLIGVGEDFTQQKEIQDALKESEEFNKSVVKNLAEGLLITDKEDRIIYANERIKDITGYSYEELRGKIAYKLLLDRTDWKFLKEKLDKRQTGVNETYIVHQKRKDGRRNWVQVNASPYRDRFGEIVGSIGAMMDISERRRVEEENALMQRLTLAISEATDLNAALEVVLKEICEYTGWEFGEAWTPSANNEALERTPVWFGKYKKLRKFFFLSIGFSFPKGSGHLGVVWSAKKSMWIKDVTKDKRFLRKALAKKFSLRACMSIPIFAKDEVVAVIAFYNYNAIEQNDRLLQLISTITAQLGPIFLRKRSEEELASSEERYRDLFENARELIQSVDTQGNYIYVNQAWLNTMGFKKTEIPNLNIKDVIHPSCFQECMEIFRQVLQGESLNVVETKFLTKDNKTITLAGSINCRFKNGKPVSTRGIFRNITEQKFAERFKIATYNIASAANQTESLDSFFKVIHTELGKLIEIRNLYISLYDKSDQTLKFPYFVYSSTRKKQPKYLENRSFENGMTEYLIKKRKPLLLQEHQIRSLRKKDLVEIRDPIPKVWVGAPLKHERDIMGAIVIQDYQHESQYRESDLHLIEFIAAQVASVIKRKQSEEKINSQAAKLSAIIESGHHKIWTIDRNYSLTSFNKSYAKMIRDFYGISSYTGMNFALSRPFIKPSHYNDWVEAFKQTFQGKVSFLEKKIIDRKGNERWIEVHLSPIVSKDGSIAEISGLINEITDKKRSEIELKKSESKFRRIFETNLDIYFRTDRNGVVNMLSPAVYDITGYRPEEVMGKNLAEYYVYKEDVDRFNKALKETGKSTNFETALYKKDGSIVYVSANSNVICDENGKVIGIEGDVRDITAKKLAEQELVRAKQLAEESSKTKTEFLANMSHELRTPMSGVLGMVDLLRDTSLNKTQQDYANTIKESAENLLSLINDIIDFSTIESKKIVLKPTTINLPEMLGKLGIAFKKEVKKDKKFEFIIQDDVPEFIQVDEVRLFQILNNLVGNAFKYTEKGQIMLLVSKLSSRPLRLKFEVKDTGIGITEKDQKRLFSKFTQLDSPLRKKFKGTGLGLAISKELVSLMKGHIGVTSQINQGSNFWFDIQVKKAGPKQLAPKQHLSAKGKIQVDADILLIEDEPVNQKVISKQLSNMGARVTCADNGKIGMEKLLTGDFDLVLMDIHMPDMSGVEVLRELNRHKVKGLPPILILTANVLSESRELLMNLGAKAYLTKPLDLEILNKLLLQHLGKKAKKISGIEKVSKETSKSRHPWYDAKMMNHLKISLGNSFKEILLDYVSLSKNLVRETEKDIRNTELKAAKTKIHNLKGTSASIGMKKISTFAAELEDVLVTDNQKEIQSKFNALKDNITILDGIVDQILSEENPI